MPPHQVFVVEDNPSDIYLLRLAFEKAGVPCDFTVFEDGAAAIARLGHPLSPAGPPKLVILDLNLPRRGGLEVLQAYRAHPDFAAVTVVVLSSSSSPREQAAIHQFTNVHYFTKPMTLDEFMAVGVSLGALLR